MAQMLHKRATTTHAIRAEIQRLMEFIVTKQLTWLEKPPLPAAEIKRPASSESWWVKAQLG